MNRVSFLLPVAALAVIAVETCPAFAGQVEKAEHIRLTEEMRRLAKRNAWKGVETAFVQLLDVEKRGEPLTSEDYYLGAQAARALGRINDVDFRLRGAARLGGTPEIIEWLQDLDTNYGKVELESKRKDPVLLEAVQLPFAPDKRTTIEVAAQDVTNTKVYSGLLPVGEYHFAEKTFTVTPGMPVKIVLTEDKTQRQATKKPDEPFRLAYVGPRVSLGPAVTQVGAPGQGQESLAESGPQAFSTFGGRLGIGLEVGFTEHLGVLAELGFTAGMGSSLTDEDASKQTGIPLDQGLPFDLSPASTIMGYGWLAGMWRTGNLSVALGPTWHGGTARSLLDMEETKGAEGLVHPTIQSVEGRIYAGGAATGLSYAVMHFGSFNGAISLYGGAHTDLSRWYTWEELAFTLTSSGSRRK